MNNIITNLIYIKNMRTYYYYYDNTFENVDKIPWKTNTKTDTRSIYTYNIYT